MRYPAAQLVTIILIAVPTRAEPNTLPTTVGMVEKKAPFAIPLIIANAAKDGRPVDAGHKASILSAVRASEMNREFRGPITSHSTPLTILPTAEEKLNPAKSPAPEAEDRPMEVA
jgi:hypothetical protein